MPISLGRKSKLLMSKASDLLTAQAEEWCNYNLAGSHYPLASKAPSRLVDLRSPDSFRSGFIPGSYNISDICCVEAARHSGLFDDREIYLLADDPDQLNLCCEDGDLGHNSKMAGWFAADALDEWRKAIPQTGCLEVLTDEALALRIASCTTLVLHVSEHTAHRRLPPPHPTALCFTLQDLPLSLDGLPVETAICLTANNIGIASYASSLVWNFGFHKLSYLIRG